MVADWFLDLLTKEQIVADIEKNSRKALSPKSWLSVKPTSVELPGKSPAWASGRKNIWD